MVPYYFLKISYWKPIDWDFLMILPKKNYWTKIFHDFIFKKMLTNLRCKQKSWTLILNWLIVDNNESFNDFIVQF